MILRHGNELLVRMDDVDNEVEANAVDRAIKAVHAIKSEDMTGIATFVCGLITCIISGLLAGAINSTGHMGPVAAMIFVGFCTLPITIIACIYFHLQDVVAKRDAVLNLTEAMAVSTLATKYVREWERANPAWTEQWARAYKEHHRQTAPGSISPA